MKDFIVPSSLAVKQIVTVHTIMNTCGTAVFNHVFFVAEIDVNCPELAIVVHCTGNTVPVPLKRVHHRGAAVNGLLDSNSAFFLFFVFWAHYKPIPFLGTNPRSRGINVWNKH